MKVTVKDFYKSFLLTANEIRTYIKIYERQDKDTMVKFTRSACLYRIFNYYEFTSKANIGSLITSSIDFILFFTSSSFLVFSNRFIYLPPMITISPFLNVNKLPYSSSKSSCFILVIK